MGSKSGASRRKDPVTVFDIRQGQPEMPLCRHQSCHRPPNGTGGLLGGAERHIRSFVELFDVLRINFSPSSSSLSRSAWYACSTAMVCRHEPAWPATAYPLSTSADYVRSGGQSLSLQRWRSIRRQIARERLFQLRHHSVTALTRPHHITVVFGRGDEEAGRKRFCPWSRHLGVEIGEKRQAPMWRWCFNLQKAFVQLTSLWFNMTFGRPVDV